VGFQDLPAAQSTATGADKDQPVPESKPASPSENLLKKISLKRTIAAVVQLNRTANLLSGRETGQDLQLDVHKSAFVRAFCDPKIRVSLGRPASLNVLQDSRVKHSLRNWAHAEVVEPNSRKSLNPLGDAAKPPTLLRASTQSRHSLGEQKSAAEMRSRSTAADQVSLAASRNAAVTCADPDLIRLLRRAMCDRFVEMRPVHDGADRAAAMDVMTLDAPGTVHSVAEGVMRK